MAQVTVVGGGLAGLVAAIRAVQEGASVRLLEAHSQLGGRARSTDGPFVANFGPHALYKGLSNWRWLKKHDLLPPTVTPPPLGVRYRHAERLRKTLPPQLLRALPLMLRSAPAEEDFRSWVASRKGSASAELACGLAGALSFHHDPGSLSAAFVAERLRWVYAPPSIRHVKGGWGELTRRLGEHAEQIGVSIQTGVRVTEIPDPPVVLAMELHEARSLLADETLRAEGAICALLDLVLEHRRGDPIAILDLENGALIESFSSRDGTVAPDDCRLIQAHIGIKGTDGAEEGTARLELLMDEGFPGWRERLCWRRRQVSLNRTGAVDLPGRSWKDRPAIDRGNGIFLAGDMVRAPGFLSEVSFTSAQQAASAATAWPFGASEQATDPPTFVVPER